MRKKTVFAPTNQARFSQLFCLFRARSTLLTLTRLGDALAEIGLVLDESTLSHWQCGVRLPKDRAICLQLIKVLFQHQGIRRLSEANELLAACAEYPLTVREEKYIRTAEQLELPKSQRPAWFQPVQPVVEPVVVPTDVSAVKLHLILPAEINQFLSQQARLKDSSKSAIVRSLIEKEMEE